MNHRRLMLLALCLCCCANTALAGGEPPVAKSDAPPPAPEAADWRPEIVFGIPFILTPIPPDGDAPKRKASEVLAGLFPGIAADKGTRALLSRLYGAAKIEFLAMEGADEAALKKAMPSRPPAEGRALWWAISKWQPYREVKGNLPLGVSWWYLTNAQPPQVKPGDSLEILQLVCNDYLLRHRLGYQLEHESDPSVLKPEQRTPAELRAVLDRRIEGFIKQHAAPAEPKGPEATKRPPAGERSTSITEENYDKIKAASGKWTEADVIALLGPAQRFRIAGKGGVDLIWEDVSRIRVEFVKNKAAFIWGEFAKNIPSKTLNLENLRKLREGMTEKEVKSILGPDGEKHTATTWVRGGVGPFDDLTVMEGKTLIVWQKVRRIMVQFSDGKVSGYTWTYYFLVKD